MHRSLRKWNLREPHQSDIVVQERITHHVRDRYLIQSKIQQFIWGILGIKPLMLQSSLLFLWKLNKRLRTSGIHNYSLMSAGPAMLTQSIRIPTLARKPLFLWHLCLRSRIPGRSTWRHGKIYFYDSIGARSGRIRRQTGEKYYDMDHGRGLERIFFYSFWVFFFFPKKERKKIFSVLMWSTSDSYAHSWFPNQTIMQFQKGTAYGLANTLTQTAILNHHSSEQKV